MGGVEPAPAILIFGAGKTGRGFLAHLCARAGRSFILIDRDRDLVAALANARTYPVENLRTGEVVRLEPAAVLHIGDDAWLPAFRSADLCFTAVFGNNLSALGRRLADGMTQRDVTAPLDIVTAENLTRAAAVLRSAVEEGLSPQTRGVAMRCTGFVEAMVLKTCLGPASGGDPLAIRAQDMFRLPCDGDAFVGALPPLPDLQPLPRFSDQLTRKIFTYNCINAVISYLGAAKGYQELSAAACDPEIDAQAITAGEEASRALVGEYGFDAKEQRAWVSDALAKFRDPGIPDPIDRNAADPDRKLARDDRLVGPALLALKHGVEPFAIAGGIIAAARYRDRGKLSPIERTKGALTDVLTGTCGLREDERLFHFILGVASRTPSGPRHGA